WILYVVNVGFFEWPSIVTTALLWLAVGFILWRSKAWSASLEARKRAQRAFYSLGHGTEWVYWVDENNLILDVNARMLQVLGYKANELVGKSPTLVDQGWIVERQTALWAELASGMVLDQESFYQPAKGPHVPVRQQLHFFQDENDRYLCVFARDVSRELEVAQQLEHTRGLFELFLEGLSTGVFIRDNDGKFIYSNTMFRRWNPQISAGKTLWEVYNPETAELFFNEDRQVIENGPMNFFNGDSNNTDGQFFEILKFPIFLPSSPPLIAGLTIDVTRRHLSELRLTESTAYLEAIVQQSPIGIILLDAATRRIRTLNKGAQELLELQNDFYAEELPFELLEISGDVPALEAHPVHRAFARESTTNDRMILRRRDGKERYVLVNAGPVFNEKGIFLAAIVTLQDITELRQAEAQLEQMNRRLESMVVDRTRELIDANEALKNSLADLRRTQNQLVESEKLASLGGLVAGVAHEINTPVGVGVTAASFLREKTEEMAGLLTNNQLKRSELDHFISLSLESTALLLANMERASNLIKSFKMISADQSTDQRRIFGLKAYLEEVFVTLRPSDKRLHVQVRVDGDASLEISGYPGALAQIVTNLFMNSCLHGFEGRSSGRIQLQFRTDGQRLVLIYTDDGKGMETSVVKHVFEPFFTTRRDLGGTGLGMNIVFNLVRRKLGGNIEAWSRLGEGVRFTIDVPLTPPVNEAEIPSVIAG
ncbi:MAG: PAS domain-containing protein, partial [Spirochaetales bacterium]|nr:PAS domain-containing protein [Spirochaetales bacterium]